jgi:hypothetical protein
MKAAQDLAPRKEPTGKLVNRPIQVEDSLDAIVRAMGGNADMLKGKSIPGSKAAVPVAEY